MLLRSMLLVVVLVFGAVRGVAADPVRPDPAGDAIPIQMALYFAPQPTVDPMARLKEICSAAPVGFLVIAEASLAKNGKLPLVFSEWVSLDEYAPPSSKSWPYRTRGLSPDLQPTLAAATQVLVLNFRVAKAEVLAANLKISQIIADLADATGGLPWDEETRRLYAAKIWRTERVETWKNGTPDIRKHIVIEAYRDGEFIRAVTLGMRKFAKADLVVEGVIAHSSIQLGHAINTCAQHVIEEHEIKKGRLMINFALIRHPDVKASMLKNPGPGATGKTQAILKPVKPQDGDAENALLEVDFAVPGASRQERHQAAVKMLFGAKDSLVKADKDNPELKAASAQARVKLMELRPRVVAGFETNERLIVKGPFTSDDGRTEWMWVEVTSWKGPEIKGSLINEPFWVKTLKPGSAVVVKETEVFDYIWTKPDGSTEGNETAKFLTEE